MSTPTTSDPILLRYKTAMETYNRRMDEYRRAQSMARSSGGAAIQGFPSKPQLEWCFDPGFDPTTLSFQSLPTVPRVASPGLDKFVSPFDPAAY